MSELLDQIEARIEALTQPDDHPKRALFAVGDVARLLAAVRAVEEAISDIEIDARFVSDWEDGRVALAAEIRVAIDEALEGEG